MTGQQNVIVFIGLSPSAAREVAELRLLGNQVLLISNGRIPDHIRGGARDFDLAQASGRSGFTTWLGIAEPQASAVSSAIADGRWNSRDELAQLARVWAHAERTRVFPGRMAISGEHVPGMFFGRKGNGVLLSENIRALAAAFPRAAAAVEDLYLSACNTAGDIGDWPKIFPNLQTIWAYLHTAPSLKTGAGTHMRMWDRATRGHQKRIDRLVAKNTGRGENVAVWSRLFGVQTGLVESIEVLRARIVAAEGTFTSFFAGDSVVVDHQSGPLRQYYDTLQSLLQHDDLPDDERRTRVARADITIRLIYFDSIRAAFAKQYKNAIAAGYSALGLPIPDFSQLDRKTTLASIAEFEAKVRPGATAAVTQLRPLLVDGLRDLDGRYIPANWI